MVDQHSDAQPTPPSAHPRPGPGPLGAAAPGAERRSAAVFDLDGVLADVRHRLHHVTSRPKRWDAFFAAAPLDPPLAQGLAVVAEAVEQGHVIVYLTGRPERCRADTLAWLAAHGLPEGELFMRDNADRRPARFTKVARLRTLAGRLPVAMLVDDDAAVVDAVRSAGFPVLHATWMSEQPSSSSSGLEAGTRSVESVLFEVQEAEGRT